MAKYTTSAHANIFYDPTTGIKITKGSEVELTSVQLMKPRIRRAINNGHLVMVIGSNTKGTENMTQEKDIISESDQVKAKFNKMIEEGTDAKKIAKAFNINQLKMLCEAYEIEVEADDTKATISEVLFDATTPSDDSEDEDEEE